GIVLLLDRLLEGGGEAAENRGVQQLAAGRSGRGCTATQAAELEVARRQAPSALIAWLRDCRLWAGAEICVGPVARSALCLARKIQRLRRSPWRLRRDRADAGRLSHRAVVRDSVRPQLLILASGSQAFAQCGDGAQRDGDCRGRGQRRRPTWRARVLGLVETCWVGKGPYHFSCSWDVEREMFPRGAIEIG